MLSSRRYRSISILLFVLLIASECMQHGVNAKNLFGFSSKGTSNSWTKSSINKPSSPVYVNRNISPKTHTSGWAHPTIRKLVPPPPYNPRYKTPTATTFIQVGAALPAGATYYPQPPKSSSGLGFGTGFIGGAILENALTPRKTRIVKHVYGGGGGRNGGDDKIIIINNGPPGSVTTTDVGSGTAVLNTGVAPQPAAPADPAAPVAPAAPAAPATPAAPAAPAAPADPNAAPFGIICVPMRVPETDPADPTKTIEVEKIACYPAPPPESVPAATNGTVTGTAKTNTAAVNNNGPRGFPAPSGGGGVGSGQQRGDPNYKIVNRHVSCANRNFSIFSLSTLLAMLVAKYLH